MAFRRSSMLRRKWVRFGLVGAVAIGLIIIGVSLDSRKPAAPHRPYLISLGGSIAAGAGLRGVYHSSYHLPLACDQTDQSYALLLAQDQHLPLLQVACSGALTSHGLFAAQVVRHHSLRPQVMEAEAMARGSIATVFVGANDAHWIHLEYMCFSHGCPPGNPSSFTSALSAVSHNIAATIVDLHHAGARAVLINEYYTALTTNNAMSCGRYALTSQDVTRYQAMLEQLNAAITTGFQKAKAPTAYLVPLDFSQHGICSQQPWVQGLTEAEPFHPTAAGQQAIAAIDEAVLVRHGV